MRQCVDFERGLRDVVANGGVHPDSLASYFALADISADRRRQLAAMDVTQDRTVNSFEELAALVQPFRKNGSWIFRGVRQSNYELTPKIGRPGSRKAISGGGDLPYDRKSEETMVRHFIRAAGPYVRHLPANRLEWLALAQHHGMFTRLLDWSESLFVAAYFAVEDARDRPNPPMIYAVKDVPLAPPLKEHDDLEALEDVVMYYPPHISPRIPAQTGLFAVHKNPDKPFQPQNAVRITIGGGPLTLKLNLNKCGIHKASLFPDIDGLAEYQSWLY